MAAKRKPQSYTALVTLSVVVIMLLSPPDWSNEELVKGAQRAGWLFPVPLVTSPLTTAAARARLQASKSCLRSASGCSTRCASCASAR